MDDEDWDRVYEHDRAKEDRWLDELLGRVDCD
jgi:hypothetical protein